MTLRSGPVSAFLVVAGLVSLVLTLTGAPAGVLHYSTLPLVSFGLCFPLLVRWAPDESSVLKLALLSVVGSRLASELLLGLVFPRSGSGLVLFLMLATLLQLVARRTVFRFDPPGKAAWIALGLALVFGLVRLVLTGWVGDALVVATLPLSVYFLAAAFLDRPGPCLAALALGLGLQALPSLLCGTVWVLDGGRDPLVLCGFAAWWLCAAHARKSRVAPWPRLALFLGLGALAVWWFWPTDRIAPLGALLEPLEALALALGVGVVVGPRRLRGALTRS